MPGIATREARLDRLESIDAIRQLAAKYSLALDMRDADAWVGLFPDDVKVGEGRTGRAALRDWFDQTMRVQFDGTSHHIGGHIIEFEDPDHAQGVVYSKNEHETGALEGVLAHEGGHGQRREAFSHETIHGKAHQRHLQEHGGPFEDV